jgi:DNA gyrase subunit A
MGVINIRMDYEHGVVAARSVSPGDEILVMSSGGNVMRTKVDEVSIQKRNTRGVRIMNLEGGDRIVGVAVVRANGEGENGTPPPVTPRPPA